MKFSIIVPVYNVEEFLHCCIRSILAQTFKDFELILINDGSTDNSLEICQWYSKRFSNIKLFDRKNFGVSATRNFGISKSSGDYILFVDSDDYLMPNTCEILNAKIKNEDYIFFKYFIKNKNQLKKIETSPLSPIDNPIDLAGENFSICYTNFLITSVYAKCYKRSNLISRFNESLYLGEDILFNIDCLKNSKTVLFIDEHLYVYRSNVEGSLVNTYRVGRIEQQYYLHHQSLLGYDTLFQNVEYNRNLITIKFLKDTCTTVNKIFSIESSYADKVNTIHRELKSADLNNYFHKIKKDWKEEAVIFKIYLFFLLKNQFMILYLFNRISLIQKFIKLVLLKQVKIDLK